MDLDAPIDVTIGPYETYNDELFGYKASFEAYITLRDEAETNKVGFFSDHLQEIENNLPLAPKYRNPKIGAQAPIRVVNELISSGDAAHGVRTAAYNLPNDERVIREKGSKRVMLKNVQEAKFRAIAEADRRRVLPAAQVDLSFDWFFTHILAHELTHGIGPHTQWAESSPRLQLKELYSAMEEAKADVCGLFMLQYMLDRGCCPAGPMPSETVHHLSGVGLPHAPLRSKGSARPGDGRSVQLPRSRRVYCVEGGTIQVHFPKKKYAVRELDQEPLTIEATGDYGPAKKMLNEMAVLRPNLKAALDGLKDIPTEINPSPVTARQSGPRFTGLPTLDKDNTATGMAFDIRNANARGSSSSTLREVDGRRTGFQPSRKDPRIGR